MLTQTIQFNQMNTFQQIEFLSDMFGESIFSVSYVPYWELSDQEQKQVQEFFFEKLQKENITITSNLIRQIEDKGMEFLAQALRRYGYTPAIESELSESMTKLNDYINQKVTIVKFSEFGFPVVIQTILNNVEVKSYAQYKESLQLTHKPKRKRTLYRNTVLPGESLMIFKGWLNIDVNSLTNDTSYSNGVTVKQSKYHSFDQQYLQDVLNLVKVSPIVKLI